MADPVIDNHRVIVEGEIRLVRENTSEYNRAFARLGNYEWKGLLGQDHKVYIKFKRIIEDAGKEHEKIEADIYNWSAEKGFYHVKKMTSTSMKEDKYYFTADNAKTSDGYETCVSGITSLNVLITIRIKRERCTFPDFTTKERHFRPITGVLKIGDQQFHVNKEYLAAISPTYFNQLFNGQFAEGGREKVQLMEMDADAFHEFLLVVNTHLREEHVLPDENTVAALLEFAQFFDIDFLKQLCGECLVLAREMSDEDRITLAHKYGLFRAVDLILADVGDVDKVKRVIQKIMRSN